MHVMGSISPANESESFLEDGVAVAALVSPPPHSGSPAQPPPPPPPPPLLPPPPPPPLGNPGGGQRRKRRVRSFFWKTIPEDQVRGRSNLWTQGGVQQQYQIDVQTIEELFGHNDCRSNAGTAPTRGSNARGSFRDTKEEVCILDSKRGMNVGIFLKQFKRTNQTIIDDIRHGNSEFYSAEPLRELLKLLPESEEVKKLQAFSGDITKLPLADSFMYLLTQIPSYTVRIEAMVLKEEFPSACESMKRDINIVHTAARELLTCEELHAVLHLVLQAGNILNSGGYAGNAVGFKLSSLLSLADTKANKPGMNLLHFVALEAQKKDPRLLEFPGNLKHVQTAARISMETLDADLHSLMSRMRSVEESLQRDMELLQQLDLFLQSATSSLCALRRSRQDLQKTGGELIDFFCEDKESFRLDDCFTIFYDFFTKFNNAVRENRERELKEEARRRRLRELEEQKRHSWAGGEKLSGAFGIRCSSETDMDVVLARHDEAGLLMELLSPKSRPRSPNRNTSSHCPLGRSGSVRRSRSSLSNSPSAAADRELSMLLGITTSEPKVTAGQLLSESPAASPGLSPQTGHQSQGHAVHMTPPQTSSPTSKTSWSLEDASTDNGKTNACRTTSTYLNHNATQPGEQNKHLSVKPTSDSNSQLLHTKHTTDHTTKGEDELHLEFSVPETVVHREKDLKDNMAAASENTDQSKSDVSGRIVKSPSENNPVADDLNSMSVVLETLMLVPDLQAFDKAASPSDSREHYLQGDQQVQHHLQGYRRDDIVVTDLEQDDIPKFEMEDVQKASRSKTMEGSEELLHRSGGQEMEKNTSFVPAVLQPLEPRAANEHPVPVPANSQSVPVSCDDSTLPASSINKTPAANETHALNAQTSTKQPRSQDKDADMGLESPRKHSANGKTEFSSSTIKNKEQQNSSRTPSKSVLSRAAPPFSKPSITSSAPTAKPNAVRTLTSSEKQSMRRVVPIARPGQRISSQEKRVDKSATVRQSASSLTISDTNNNSHRRREKPSASPCSSSSQPSRIQMQESKDPKLSDVHRSAGEKVSSLQRRPSARKPAAKAKPQAEEKMCRSTLRALAQAAAVGGGRGEGSISTPTTPSHKVVSSSTLPGFTRSTASSSFRQTHTTLAPPRPPPPLHGESESSKSSSPLIRTGSLRVPLTSKAVALPPTSCSSSSSSPLRPLSQDSPLRRSQSIRVSLHSYDSMAPPKGHRRNNSGSLSDKSSHSRDSTRTSKPSWR
ncbi:FH2 domain-containing protein 1-like [Lampris incognitus]|uniref:FH2 domain-containing protein 1-like n=1 Tax=Lampris incognitus TaxID=2546036 RepID=UPI0024B5C7CF|nr:FH2 domain-containing protein 1-like [Lampris incognitus]